MAGRTRHLLERDGRYSARLAVPISLRSIVGKRELTKTLGADRARALRRLTGVVAEMQLELDAARLTALRQSPPKYRAGRPLSEKQIARAHYESEIAIDSKLRSRGYSLEEHHKLFQTGYVEVLQRIASGAAEDDEARAAVGWAIDQFVENGNLRAPYKSQEWRKAARTLASIQLEVAVRQSERDRGREDHTPFHPLLAPDAADERKNRILGPDSTKLLADLLPAFLGERRAKGATEYEYNVAVRMFDEVAGEPLPAFKITRQHVHAFKAALSNRPVNASKRFPGMSLPDAIEANKKRVDPFPTLDPKTINDKWLARIHALFGWCVKNDILPDNPAAGIKVANTGEKSQRPRVPFKRTDLASIFNPEKFSKTDIEQQWCLLVALFSGMRVSEIGQLKLNSIRTERGILVFDVEEETKNRQSQRIVPVHSKLIELGLEKRIGQLTKRGETHLFPDWFEKSSDAKTRATPGKEMLNQHFPKYISRWFNGTYKKNIGLNDKRKVFHSFRHTFKSGLATAGVLKSVRDDICGHNDTSAGSVYVHGTSIETMKDAIEKLRFEGFELTA